MSAEPFKTRRSYLMRILTMSDTPNKPELTPDELALLLAFRSGDKDQIVALTGKLLVKHEQPAARTPEKLAADFLNALESGQDADAIGDALASIFKHYFPPSEYTPAPTPKAQPATDHEQALIDAYRSGDTDAFATAAGKAARQMFTDKPYRGTYYSLGTASTAHHGIDDLGEDSNHLRRAWYLVGALVESNFANFEFDVPEWEHELELLLITLSQALKQTER
jgi:hypothetical protein